MDPPAGCCFHTRCPYAIERRRAEKPALTESDPGHWSACRRSAELTLKSALEFGAVGA